MHPKLTSSALKRLFFGTVITAGSSIALEAALDLWTADLPKQWIVLATLTLLTGSFTIRIPRLSIRISVSDAFVFAAVLRYGASAATVIVAIDSLVATLWMRRENRSVFRSAFNLSVASLSIWSAATVFHFLAEPITRTTAIDLTGLLVPLFVLASTYFLLNSWLIATALAFERSTSVVQLWWTHFPWFSLNYFGGVSAAALVVSYTQSFNLGSISILLPLLTISYLTYRTSLGRVQDAQHHLEQMNALYMSTIEALAMAVDAKDQITHGHIRRVQVYALELSKRLGVMDPAHLNAIETAALLHDMGKLAIPEHILNKPGTLNSIEFDKMKRHSEIGADLLSSIKFPYPVVPIVRHHHENWNGSGYPNGISGTDIPLGARILSVVDCFDALTSDRPYRPRLSNEAAFQVLIERRGSMYDPMVVDTFIAVYPDVAQTAIQAGIDARTLAAGSDRLDLAQTARESSLSQIRANAFEHSVLSELQRRLSNANTLDVAVHEISAHLRQLTPATVFGFFTRHLLDDDLICEFAAGDFGLLRGIRIRVGEKITGWCASTQQSSVNSHAYLDLGPISEHFEPKLLSAISVPLVLGGKVFGVLTAYSAKPNAFSDEHQYLFERVVNLAKDRLQSGLIPGESLRNVIAFRG